MRFLIRLVVLGLAAFGAKALYDKLAPHSDEFKRTGADLADRTTSAAREVAGKATEAAQRVAATAQQGATTVKDTAAEQAQEVKSAAEEARNEARDALTADAGNGSPAARPSI
jgi:hypothetical protein